MSKLRMGLISTLVFLSAASGVLSSDAQRTVLRGKTVDQAGKAVEGAEVVALARTYGPAVDTFSATVAAKAVSGKDGSFELAADKPGELWIVAAHKPGLAIGWQYARPQDLADLNVTLGLAVTVPVALDTKTPIKSAKLHIILSRTDEDGRTLDLPTAGLGWPNPTPVAAGFFALSDIPATGSYMLVAEAPGFSPRFSYPQTQRPSSVSLASSIDLKGRLLDADGAKPVSGMRVLVESEDRPAYVRPMVATTGKDGSFTVAGLDSGAYLIRVARDATSAPEWATETTRFFLGGDDPNALAFKLIAGPLLEVSLTDANSCLPIGRAEVHVGNMLGPVWYFKRFTALDGRCLMRVRPRAYRTLTAFKTGYFEPADVAREKGVDMSSGEDKTLAMQMTAMPLVAGIVRDADGQPLAGAEVHVVPGPWESPTPTTDAAGAFRLRVDPQTWKKTRPMFIARHEGRNLAIATELPENLKVDVKLKPARTIKGRVTDAAGKPVEDACVNIEYERASFRPTIAWGKSDKEGAYSTSGIPDLASLRFIVDRGDDYTPAYRDVSGDANTASQAVADFALEGCTGTVSGKVVGPDGLPMANVPVRRSIECVPHHWYESTVTTGPNGEFKFDHLPKGRINLNVQIGEKQLTGHVEVESGATNVKIELSRSAWSDGAIINVIN
jgi:protocatechuate 3,4-dioxygenase beta subunit